jgi:UDP-glucose 4-epimerase
MRIAIGGSRGFIGGHVARYWNEQHAASGSDDGSVAGFGRGEPAPRADGLLWAAGGRGDDAEMQEAHVDAPVRALRASGAKTVVFLSSGEVYGRIGIPFREDAEPRPESPYGRAKLRGEEAIAAAASEFGARCFILRLPVVYGPHQRPGMLLPNVTRALVAAERVDTTHGAQTRDFVEVADVVRLIARCFESDAPAGCYNAGSGVEVSVKDVLRTLARLIGPDREALIQFGARAQRPGEAQRYLLDATRALERLGWKAAVSLETGLRRLIASV